MSLPLRLILLLALAACSISGRAGIIDRDRPTISYVSFSSSDPVRPLTVAGQFRVPAGVTSRVPAVVVVHGSSGIDSRGEFYVSALNAASIATLEIDMWAARGLSGGITGRPQSVPETLPDAYGALRFLTQQPYIDPERIGILGFSWGGVVTMLSATKPYTQLFTDGACRFAAHVAHYPVCWIYNRIPGHAFSAFTGAPVLIQAGELDTYDLPDTCPNLVASLPVDVQAFISVKMYRHASHAWDRLQPPITVIDPFSHLGKGGEVDFLPNLGAAIRARHTATHFFQKAFGMSR